MLDLENSAVDFFADMPQIVSVPSVQDLSLETLALISLRNVAEFHATRWCEDQDAPFVQAKLALWRAAQQMIPTGVVWGPIPGKIGWLRRLNNTQTLSRANNMGRRGKRAIDRALRIATVIVPDTDAERRAQEHLARRLATLESLRRKI